MHSLRVGMAVGALSLTLLAGCMTEPSAPTTPLASGHPHAPTTTTMAKAWNGTGPGDGPPDEGDNGSLPRSISPADRQAGDAAAAKAKTALTKVQQSGSVTQTKVRSALAKAGFDPKEFYAVRTGSTITFGITVGGACVEGSVDRAKLDATVRGPVPDWGCGIVGPTH